MDYFDNNNLKNPKGSIIYKAILKYGHDNFNLKILEYCSINDLMVREQYYLDTLGLPDYARFFRISFQRTVEDIAIGVFTFIDSK